MTKYTQPEITVIDIDIEAVMMATSLTDGGTVNGYTDKESGTALIGRRRGRGSYDCDE